VQPTATAVAALPTPATPAPIPTTPPPKMPSTVTPSPAVSAVTPSPAVSAPTPSHKPAAHVTTMPTTRALTVKSVALRRAVAQNATPKPSPSPLRSISPPPTPQMPSSSAGSVASVGADGAAAVVRSYLQALAQGDRATAISYLAHGTPSETFMDPNARIESVRSTNVGLSQYHVTADVLTASGEYYVTCIVEQGPSGLQITDHYWIKPQ
jgi:hypothetical protein